MKKWLCLVLFLTTLTYSITALLPSRIRVSAAEDDLQLHAKYAVLLDGDSGRVLYGKNEDTPAPMASTTKIMSCVIALEYGLKEMTCTTSAYAASMPDVQLNAKKGETFTLNDLLYSLMLKSHNDSAVIIAENTAVTIFIRFSLAFIPIRMTYFPEKTSPLCHFLPDLTLLFCKISQPSKAKSSLPCLQG